MTPNRSLRAALPLVVVLTLVWGTNWALFPLVVREISVWTFRLVTTLGAGAILLAIAAARGQSLKIPRGHRGTVVAAALAYLVIWNIASTYSAILIPSGQAAVLGFTMPLWTALLGRIFLGQRLTAAAMLAVLLGGVAVALLAARGLQAYAQAPLGFAVGLFAGLGWAVGTLILKRRPLPVSPLVLTGWQLLIASVPIGIGAAYFGGGQWFMPSWPTILLLTYITLIPIAIGNVAWFAIVGLLPAHIAGSSSVMVPVVAMLTGALMHREPLGVAEILAMLCSAAAVALSLRKPAS